MSAISDILKDIRLPRMVRVHQQFDSQVVEDIPGEITRQLSGDFPHGIKAGMSVAITCGSRGIANLSTIMRTVVDFCISQGAHPFIIPAMGSHAGATAEGQQGMLAALGVTEESCGCPIISSMETKVIGQTAEGHVVQIDRHAAEADGIIVTQAMTERASPLTGRQGLCLADAFGRERASPLTAARSLGSDRASDGAMLPLGQDPQKNRPASVSSGRLGTPAGDAAQRVHQYLAGLLDRYFLTIKATLKTIASSNSRRSRPVSFLIFSRRYTSVLRWTNRPRLVSETFRLFSKKR